MTHWGNPMGGAVTMLYRSLEDWGDLEVRVKGDEGIVSGIAVPWDKPTRINGSLTEEFARGAFDRDVKKPQNVFLARGHMPLGGSPIGRLSGMRNDTAGLFVEGRVSRTPIGEETLTLLRDGVLDRFSIGFLEGTNEFRQDGRQQVTRRVTASLREVAIVATPAYVDARVTGVRGDLCPACAAAGEPSHRERDEFEELLLRLPKLPPVPRTAHRR